MSSSNSLLRQRRVVPFDVYLFERVGIEIVELHALGVGLVVQLEVPLPHGAVDDGCHHARIAEEIRETGRLAVEGAIRERLRISIAPEWCEGETIDFRLRTDLQHIQDGRDDVDQGDGFGDPHVARDARPANQQWNPEHFLVLGACVGHPAVLHEFLTVVRGHHEKRFVQ